MRIDGNKDYFMSLFNAFESRHEDHIKAYGSNNHLRLTGEYETQAMDKFSWGISDRGASIRVPQDTAKEWKGYVEDRRPGSNADPYKIIREIVKSLYVAELLYDTKSMINKDVDMNGLSEKYGTMSDEELLKEYREDDDYELDDETMLSKTNIEPQEEIDSVRNYIDKRDNKIVNPMPDLLKNALMNAKNLNNG
jgi:hypothetical protein